MSLVDIVNSQNSQILQNAELLDKVQQLEDKIGHPAVHKFGGSSLRSGAAINQVACIIEKNCYPNDYIVVSAMGKTTDILIETVENNLGLAKPDCSKVYDYQRQIIEEVLPATQAQILLSELDNDIQRISFLLSHADDGEFNQADVVGYGELWSTRVVCAVLKNRNIKCHRVDSRDFIYTENLTQEQARTTDTAINWSKSQGLFNRCKGDFRHALAVVSGFIASDNDGQTVTLGRNGSDFSATIVAKLASAKIVYLWTDVNGVFTADPNMISQTSVVPLLGLNEASALANLGTSVFHEKTLKPLQDDNIPIRIRNSQASVDDATNAGTLILTQPVKWQGAKTIALKESVCLFTVTWHNGEAHDNLNDTFAAILRQKQIPMYCWLNQDGRLSFCVPERCQTSVAKILTQQQVGDSCQFSVNKDLSIISLVGFELLQHGEHLSAFFSLLEQSKKEVKLYHYDTHGAISAVIADRHPVQLVSSIHQAIFVGKAKRINNADQLSVVLWGYGNIGKRVVDILADRIDVINARVKQKIKVVGIVNSTQYVFDANGLDLANAGASLALSRLPVESIEEDLRQLNDHNVCVIDVTASQQATDLYQHHFAKGRHVISANKLGATLPTEQYTQLVDLAASNKCRWLGNVTCGAGLPIQQSIEELCLSGDRLKSIEGVFSGTLSWLLKQFDGSKPFSQVVAEAKAIGLTEPDPRDDLSGKDVQRKLLILARAVGIKLDLEQIQLTPLIPQSLLDLDEAEYLDRSAELDKLMQEKLQHAKAQGLALCYSGELVFGRHGEGLSIIEANVGLSFRSPDEPLVNINAADNIAVIRSQWHDANPLIIRGPGAGIDVTASGVIADLVKLVN